MKKLLRISLLVFVSFTSNYAYCWSLSLTDFGADGAYLVSTQEQLHRLVIFSGLDFSSVASVGSKGSAPGQFLLPLAALVDSKKRLWVCDTLNNRIQILDFNGTPISEPGFSFGELGLDKPNAIVDDRVGSIYILDSGNKRVIAFDYTGKFVSEIKLEGEDLSPVGIAVDRVKKKLYVLNMAPARVDWYHLDSKRQGGSFGKYGIGDGDLLVPLHLTTDKEGNVYVSDDQANRITKFNYLGKYLSSWGYFGVEKNSLYHPQGIAVSDEGRLYVLDYGNHRGVVYDTKGIVLGEFGSGAINSDAQFK